MNLSRNELSKRLKRQIDTRYLIYGREQYLNERCVELIRERVLADGDGERIPMTVNADFSWSDFSEQIGQHSLFSSKKLIELRLPSSGRPGAGGDRHLTDCLKATDSDTTVVLIAGAIDASAKRAKWFQAWCKEGVAVDNPELSASEYQNWIKNSLERSGITFESGVVNRLAYYFESNMPAAANEIRKLRLSDESSRLTVSEIDRIVVDQARFNVFALVDAFLAGNASRVLRLLRLLKNEGAEPMLVLWALARESRIVYRIAYASSKKMPLDPIFTKLRVWSSRQRLIMQAARRLDLAGSERCLQQLARADHVIKGLEFALQGGDVWNEFEQISLEFCGIKSNKR